MLPYESTTTPADRSSPIPPAVETAFNAPEFVSIVAMNMSLSELVLIIPPKSVGP